LQSSGNTTSKGSVFFSQLLQFRAASASHIFCFGGYFAIRLDLFPRFLLAIFTRRTDFSYCIELLYRLFELELRGLQLCLDLVHIVSRAPLGAFEYVSPVVLGVCLSLVNRFTKLVFSGHGRITKSTINIRLLSRYLTTVFTLVG